MIVSQYQYISGLRTTIINMVSKSDVISELRNTDGDEFDYDGHKGSINAHLISPSSAKISHFVVARDFRREGLGSTLFESVLDVLSENDVFHITVEIQALDDGGEDDGVMEFLRRYNLEHIEPFNHHNWGRCVRAQGTTSY